MSKIEKLLGVIHASLDSNKGENIVTISLQEGWVADYFVVVGGTSVRHVASLADRVLDEVRDLSGIHGIIEGGRASDWVLIDFGDIVVHVFRNEVRSFYDLENLWTQTSDA